MGSMSVVSSRSICSELFTTYASFSLSL